LESNAVTKNSNKVGQPRRAVALALAGLCLFATAERALAQSAPFTVTSPKFADNGMLDRANAGGTFGTSVCGGDNLSPALAWSNAPAATKSFAIIVSDPDGGFGQGSVHWIAYDIAPATTSVAEGAGSKPSPTWVGGTTSRKLQTYFGPCPPVGEAPHHYHLAVYALDIAPGELAAGLTKDELLAKIKGHTLAQSSIIARYGR
jgi:hypothetical protein